MVKKTSKSNGLALFIQGSLAKRNLQKISSFNPV